MTRFLPDGTELPPCKLYEILDEIQAGVDVQRQHGFKVVEVHMSLERRREYLAALVEERRRVPTSQEPTPELFAIPIVLNERCGSPTYYLVKVDSP